MEIQKIFLGESDQAVIRCPKCGQVKTVPAIRLKDKHQFRAKCTCKAVFAVQLEFRKRYRKQTDLDGFFEKVSEESRWREVRMESISTGAHAVRCKVRNVSVLGLGFTSLTNHKLKKGDHIKIIFTLDNSASTKIEKKAIVKGVSDKYVGCEFFETDKNDPKIAFYVL